MKTINLIKYLKLFQIIDLKIIFTFIILINFSVCKSQRYVDNIFWVTIESTDVKPLIDGYPVTNNEEFNSILESNNVTFWGQAFYGAKNDIIKRIYELKCNSCNIDSLMPLMSRSLPNSFSTFRKHEVVDNKALYNPVDYMWSLTLQDPNDWLWHLMKIDANLAWNITLGNPNIKIAILDTEFDITHPDLQNKFVVPYDPYTNINFDCTPVYNHGTFVASFAAAETIESGMPGNSGQLASVGFKTMLIGYNAWTSPQEYLQKAFHASTIMHANIITSSAGGWSNCPDLTGQDQLVVQEILNNGTTIIMPAGNGPSNENHCSTVDPDNACPFFPLSPYYDSRIIIVSGTDKYDYHYYYANGQDETQSHYPMVDLCAPGHGLMGASLTDCGSNQWPYFGNCEGTSFATPIVAGVAALVLSVNPCLEPQDVKYILKSTTDPVIDADNYPNGVGTGRVNAYNAVLAAQTYGTESPIVQNTAWSSEHYINGSLIIESGSTLTISSTVRFTAGSNITVKKGAGLIVDGGLLKNATGCYNEPWQGIIVEGDANGLQDVQGYVQLTNGAIIENAITGISSPNGGIVKIYNSTILNCRTGVEILNYPNHINFGEITGSTFTTDDSWIDNQLYPNPIAFIKLDNVKYVKIWGNTFQNLRPIVESDYIGRGIGIECNDAKCSVYSNNSEQDNLFYHLRYGIYAVSTHVTNYLMIENAQFDNNFRGIYLCGMNLAKVNKNIFTIPTAGKDNYCVGHICYGHSYGLSLERCSGYQVEENNFTTDNEHFYTVGLIVKNSGIEPNLIYKNNFTDLTFGAIAQYNNRAYDGDVHPGLEFKCNNFSGSLYYDIAIAGDNGIAEFQGNTNESAENTFSHPCGNNFYDLYNESDYLLYFWTNDEPLCYYKLNPPPTTIYLFYNADNKNACASHLIGGHDPELKKSEMAAKTDSINYIKNEIDIVEDGGNTQELELEVSTAMPCEALDMRDELIDKSPYLSDSVMVSSIINESTFPAVMLRDVLIANPQSAKSDTITKSLDARTNQLPGYMREQIDEGKFVLSPLEIMKNRIDANINTRQRLLNEVLNYYLNDTLSASADSVVAILNREKSPESKLFLASLYIDRHDPESTLQLLNDIPNICQMNSSQMIEYIRMKELLTIQAELMQDSLTYYNMDSIQESTIRTLAGDCKYTAGTLARNIVYLIDSVNYEESVLMPNPQNQNKSYYNKSIEGNAKLEVFPNPALKYFIVDYSIPTDIFQSAQLSITDASGKVVIQRVLLEKENQIFFETGSLSSKEYQCSLYCGNKLVASKKFVVVK